MSKAERERLATIQCLIRCIDNLPLYGYVPKEVIPHVAEHIHDCAELWNFRSRYLMLTHSGGCDVFEFTQLLDEIVEVAVTSVN